MSKSRSVKLVSPLYMNLKRLFSKEGEFNSGANAFILNRFLSFSFKTEIRKLAERLDKYTFSLYGTDKDLPMFLMDVSIPKQKTPFLKYIRKPTEKKKTDNEHILNDLQRHYGWTDRERDLNREVLYSLLKDKKYKKKVMSFVGSDIKHFDEVPKEKQGLDYFM